MTDEQRIEAAARVLCRAMFLRVPAEDDLQNFMSHARDILRAAYPELHPDKPSHWLAPWEASDEMRHGFIGAMMQRGSSFDEVYAAMRTAHLAKDQE